MTSRTAGATRHCNLASLATQIGGKCAFFPNAVQVVEPPNQAINSRLRSAGENDHVHSESCMFRHPEYHKQQRAGLLACCSLACHVSVFARHYRVKLLHSVPITDAVSANSRHERRPSKIWCTFNPMQHLWSACRAEANLFFSCRTW